MNDQSSLEFFERRYSELRKPFAPMRWMRRLYLRLTAADPPQMVDLPTGAGKTELIVVWLIALAWYARDKANRKPVPRRLVWVVNRRVLVQQVFHVADQLATQLIRADGNSADGLGDLRQALATLCRSSNGPVFTLTQLRGQLVDDRAWSLDPAVPQLIIGTVDQIGSRLLFQGYSQGKWPRPMHAALFGIDAWICIDEAHLVPAFTLTLRQTAQFIERPIPTSPHYGSLRALFSRLPFWFTELSATPALSRPTPAKVLDLQPEDTHDEIIGDRLLAAKTRRVVIQYLADEKQLVARIVEAALAAIGTASTVAIFVRTAKAAEEIAKKLRKD